MGRVRSSKAHQPPPDTGEPGKFYFEEPVTLEIKGKELTNQGRTSSVMFPHSSTSMYATGECRLKSSHEISNYTPPTDLTYDLSYWPSKDDVANYVEKWRIQGFGEGAIVARRHQPTEFFRLPVRWGVILLACKYTATVRFNPYIVRWIGYDLGEPAWAEDLVLIHPAIDRLALLDILETQDVDISQMGTVV